MELTSPIELIKRSVNLFFEKNNLVYFIKIYSLLLPFAILSAVQQYLTTTNYPLVSWISVAFILLGMVSLIVNFLVGLAGIYAIRGIISGNILSVRGVYEAAWANLWKFSLLLIAIFLIITGGFILLIIPGVIFSVWFAFSKFIFVDKNTGIKESLSQSRQLAKGRFWPIFGRLLVIGIFYILIQILMGLVPYGVGSVLISLAGAMFVLPYYLLYRELSA